MALAAEWVEVVAVGDAIEPMLLVYELEHATERSEAQERPETLIVAARSSLSVSAIAPVVDALVFPDL